MPIVEHRAAECFKPCPLLNSLPLCKVLFRTPRRWFFFFSNRVLGQNRFLRARYILANRATELFKSCPWSRPLPLGNVHFNKSRRGLFKSRPSSKSIPLCNINFRKSSRNYFQIMYLVNVASFGQGPFLNIVPQNCSNHVLGQNRFLCAKSILENRAA